MTKTTGVGGGGKTKFQSKLPEPTGAARGGSGSKQWLVVFAVMAGTIRRWVIGGSLLCARLRSSRE